MGIRSLLLAICLVVPAGPASAQLPDSARPTNEQTPTAAPDDLPTEADVAARFDEAAAFFLLDSISVRSKLRAKGLEEKADAYWKSSAKFIELIRAADADHAPQFLPILDGFRRSLRETAVDPANVDMEGLTGIQNALDDQNEIYSAPGAFEGDRNMIEVQVRAIKANGQPVNGLYVWLDLDGSVPKGASANPLHRVTSPASGTVGPGLYVVRLISGGKEVARRSDMRLGKYTNKESIDVVVP